MKHNGHADNIVIGSGISAFAAAFALNRSRRDFTVLDIGYDLDSQTEQEIEALSLEPGNEWPSHLKEKLFPLPKASSKGVQKRLAFGSQFPYVTAPDQKIICQNCIVESSNARGGFGNVWGAAVLPFRDNELKDWPVSIESMRAAYQRVTEYLSVAEADDSLSTEFPPSNTTAKPASISQIGQTLAKVFEKNSKNVENLLWGRARLAVETANKPNRCQQCGFCLDGCAFGSIFNPRIRWQQLKLKPWNYRGGYEVLSLRKENGKIIIAAKDITNGTIVSWTANRIFLAAGAINSTVILARSMNLKGIAIPMKDAQYFFFPALLLKGTKDVPKADRFTLAEFFLEVSGKISRGRWTHFQIYTFNRIFQKALGPILSHFIANRFLLFQGFLHSDFSAKLFVTVNDHHVKIVGESNPQSTIVARWARKQAQKLLGWQGFIPPFAVKFVAPGRSFHVGSSFPMSRSSSPMTTDTLGQPQGLDGVHLVDASSFPTIPATTFAYSLMAHADRIVSEAFK